MSHYYYAYDVYEKNGVEYTLLKWIEDGVYAESRKIDKPTSDLTPDDLDILNQFIADGSLVKPKYEIDLDIPNTPENLDM